MNWWQRYATGISYLDGFKAHPKIKTRYPDGYLVFMAEDEGFEPPQTESESGVLPLHKSSICRVYYMQFSEKVNTIFLLFQFFFFHQLAVNQFQTVFHQFIRTQMLLIIFCIGTLHLMA